VPSLTEVTRQQSPDDRHGKIESYVDTANFFALRSLWLYKKYLPSGSI